MLLLYLIGPKYLRSKNIVDAQSDRYRIVTQSGACNIVVKESTTNYVIMLQIHNEVEQTLLKCQLHWPPT